MRVDGMTPLEEELDLLPWYKGVWVLALLGWLVFYDTCGAAWRAVRKSKRG